MRELPGYDAVSSQGREWSRRRYDTPRPLDPQLPLNLVYRFQGGVSGSIASNSAMSSAS